MSSQMGWPEGASAECGRAMPRASPTTCEVAAVPRNWHPPPGVAQARQSASAASCKVICPRAKRAPADWTLPASSLPSAGRVTPPGISMHASRSCSARERHHHGGQTFVAGGDADDAAARGQRTDEPSEDGGRVVAIRQRIEHGGSALAAAVAGIGAVGGEGHGALRFQFARGGFHEQADFPVAGVIAESDGRAVGGADAAVGAEDEELFAVRAPPDPSPYRRSGSSRRGRPRGGCAASPR